MSTGGRTDGRRNTDPLKIDIAEELRRRDGDALLQHPEIAELTRLTEATYRWLRHKGEGPRMFRLGGRLVAWRSDVLYWLAEQAAKDGESRE